MHHAQVQNAKEEALLEVLAKARLSKRDPEYRSYEEELSDARQAPRPKTARGGPRSR